MATQTQAHVAMDRIVVVGGGGHAKVVIDAIRSKAVFDIVGIVDPQLPVGSLVEGVAVLGGDSELPKLRASGVSHAVVAVGSVGSSSVRRKIFEMLKQNDFCLPALIHKSAYVASSVVLNVGAFVAAGAVIEPGVVVGECAIVNTGAIVDHDCQIGAFVHVAPGSVLSGGVNVGDGAHLGTATCIIENCNIGKNALVGAGSVVVSDIPAECKAFGNPCKVRNP